MEGHENGRSDFDSLRANFRAVCLLTYLASVMGEQVRVDDENDAAVSGEFMLGSDLQYLLRYCLSAHLESLRAEGNFMMNYRFSYLFILVYQKSKANGIIFLRLQSLFDYFAEQSVPAVKLMPCLSCFGFEGYGADGLEQGEGFFLGYYLGYCPSLKADYSYAIYTVSFSVSFDSIPYEKVYAEINHYMRPQHWVGYVSESVCFIPLFSYISRRCCTIQQGLLPYQSEIMFLYYPNHMALLLVSKRCCPTLFTDVKLNKIYLSHPCLFVIACLLHSLERRKSCQEHIRGKGTGRVN